MDAVQGRREGFPAVVFFQEGIHPETGRKRKDRALERISAHLRGSTVQDCENDNSGRLQHGPEFGDVSGTLDEDAGKREGLNSWMADGAFAGVTSDQPSDFSWARKRWERRRRQEAERAKKASSK